MVKKKNLVIHLGLSKTGTTTLQKNFFPKYDGFLGKRHGLGPNDPAAQKNATHNRLLKHYLRFARGQFRSGTQSRNELTGWIHGLNFGDSGLLIISDENLSQWPRGHLKELPVDYQRPLPTGAHPITVFLSELRDSLPKEINLTTIVTLRNQSDFLGSLAAETNKERYFESTGFDRIVAEGDAYLDFHHFVCDLEDISGAENNLTLLFEDGLEVNMSKIIDLIGPPNLDAEFDPGRQNKVENFRKIGENSWSSHKTRLPLFRMIYNLPASRALLWSRWWPPFRRLFRPVSYLLKTIDKMWTVPMTVEISNSDRSRIRAICRKSNDLLAAHLNRNLVDLGY